MPLSKNKRGTLVRWTQPEQCMRSHSTIAVALVCCRSHSTHVAYEAAGDRRGRLYRHEIFDASMVAVTGPAGERMRQRIPQRRFGATPDLDGALLLLASDASRYMTGSIIVVDGGFLLA